MYRLLWVGMLLVLGGCSLNNMPTPRATYTPVPDAVLFQRIADLPGVTNVDLRWANVFGNSNSYSGDVRARKGTDRRALLDRVLAILRQGRPGAWFGGVQVVVDGQFAISAPEIGLESQADYEARYGPQPGTGRPPR